MGSGISGVAFNVRKAISSKLDTLDEMKKAQVIPEGWEFLPGNNTNPLKLGQNLTEQFNHTALITTNFVSEVDPALQPIYNASYRFLDKLVGSGSTKAASVGGAAAAPGAIPVPEPTSLLFSALGVVPKLFSGEPILPVGKLPLKELKQLGQLGGQLGQLSKAMSGGAASPEGGMGTLAGLAAAFQKLRDGKDAAATAAALGGGGAGKSASVVLPVSRLVSSLNTPAAGLSAASVPGAFRPAVAKPMSSIVRPAGMISSAAIPRAVGGIPASIPLRTASGIPSAAGNIGIASIRAPSMMSSMAHPAGSVPGAVTASGLRAVAGIAAPRTGLPAMTGYRPAVPKPMPSIPKPVPRPVGK
jgi:hypothetical protein